MCIYEYVSSHHYFNYFFSPSSSFRFVIILKWWMHSSSSHQKEEQIFCIGALVFIPLKLNLLSAYDDEGVLYIFWWSVSAVEKCSKKGKQKKRRGRKFFFYLPIRLPFPSDKFPLVVNEVFRFCHGVVQMPQHMHYEYCLPNFLVPPKGQKDTFTHILVKKGAPCSSRIVDRRDVYGKVDG